ncbi:COG4223 family protein [Loktanella sp. S4079]|uniref:COG4223 family protein n=1 Tax=Loktanella sp. S4079 TaxID=579483 RepID=UPI0005FA057D|nr:hypothetical protein [Loktanella sp. S4079]KJZ19340.1 hypothetical protein TW80_11245 [Loktanella sp. S4079]
MAKQPAKGRKAPAKATKPVESTVAASPFIDSIPDEVYPEAPKPAPELKVEPVQVVEKEAKPEPVENKIAPPPSAAPARQSSGFFPLLIGGLIAGAIGYGVATITNPSADPELTTKVAEQSAAIDGLRNQIADIQNSQLAQVQEAQTNLAGRFDEYEAQIASVAVRVDTLEAMPATAGGTLPSGAYQSELDALRAQIEDMAGIAETRLETARAEAAAIEENAAAAARNAAGRAALARIQSALETGAPIGAALGDLEEALGTAAPDALLAAQDGVPTMQTLRDGFPEVARAALATARSEGVSGEEMSGFGAFLRDQFDVRSTAPREGNDADAVLSRAESAVSAGRLSDALAEIGGLPEVVRADMSEWLALAEARASAQAAIDMLSSSLSDN